MSKLKVLSIIAMSLALFSLSACKGNVKKDEVEPVSSFSGSQQVSDEDTAKTEIVEEEDVYVDASAETDIRGTEFRENAALGRIYFDFDKYALTNSAITTLKENARVLQAAPNTEILVEGHCDDRGTIEYNIALGQKRAKTVRDYYIELGIAANRISTISYGKEQPVCYSQTDTCRSQNRRGVTKQR